VTYTYYTYTNPEKHQHFLERFSVYAPKMYDEKISKFFKWQDSQLSILGIYLLKYGLKNIGICLEDHQITHTENTKPRINIPNIYYNISHSNPIVVCSISNEREVGVDIEIIRDIETSAFQHQMTNNEWNEVHNAVNKNFSFFNYWTQKEAVLKAQGCGIIDSLSSFEIVKNYTRFRNTPFYLIQLAIDPEAICHLAFKDKLDQNIKTPVFIDSLRLLQI